MQQYLILDEVNWNAVLSACEKGSQWEKALGLHHEMDHHLLTQDVISCKIALCACEKVGVLGMGVWNRGVWVGYHFHVLPDSQPYII